jgi:hypothetical protein
MKERMNEGRKEGRKEESGPRETVRGLREKRPLGTQITQHKLGHTTHYNTELITCYLTFNVIILETSPPPAFIASKLMPFPRGAVVPLFPPNVGRTFFAPMRALPRREALFPLRADSPPASLALFLAA